MTNLTPETIEAAKLNINAPQAMFDLDKDFGIYCRITSNEIKSVSGIRSSNTNEEKLESILGNIFQAFLQSALRRRNLNILRENLDLEDRSNYPLGQTLEVMLIDRNLGVLAFCEDFTHNNLKELVKLIESKLGFTSKPDLEIEVLFKKHENELKNKIISFKKEYDEAVEKVGRDVVLKQIVTYIESQEIDENEFDIVTMAFLLESDEDVVKKIDKVMSDPNLTDEQKNDFLKKIKLTQQFKRAN